ncbi:hypothetical protein VTJ83DRAFT_1835 [Remersonia thermophila]|uniref:BZIP domain-containing protein n=1 Tax=Remersonia thermophila TaxID=72144 RepID=A0ABR4DHA0_9PEZI
MTATMAQSPVLQARKADASVPRPLSVTTAVSPESAVSASSPASAASPVAVSTPTCSTGAPPIAIRPSTGPSAARNAMSPAPQTGSLSMTTKEWIIPPRPKPGRKPATDTPPTKRKAQNRAAQRAFRERRAARVGELEEQLEEEKENHEREVRELQERISHLELETQTLQSRCQMLESMLQKERQSRAAVQVPGGWERSGSLMGMQINGPSSAPPPPPPAVSLRPTPLRSIAAPTLPVVEPRPLAQPFSIAQIVSPPETAAPEGLGCGTCQSTGSCACAEEVLRSAADLAMGCGRCTLGSRCECLEETMQAVAASNELKRPLPSGSPPPTSPEEKRQRSDAGIALETDFTAMFSSQSQRAPAPTQSLFDPPISDAQLQPLASVEPRDPCGFCKDGTYCVCADAMMSASLPPATQSLVSEQTQTHTPPPSEDDVVPIPMEVTATGAIKLPGPRRSTARQPKNATAAAPSGGCGPNGPGTCAQCLADPKSGLFCRSLAANFERNNSKNAGGGGGGCCGNGGPGGCCKAGGPQKQKQQQQQQHQPQKQPPSTSDTAASRNNTLPSIGLSLSCADAYKTLASHRHFDEAADDIGSWLPKLRAVPVLPRPGGGNGNFGGGHQGGRDGASRAPIEVEAASIMSVLKDFDVRFGRGD